MQISAGIQTILSPQVWFFLKEDANIGRDPNYIVASSSICSKGRRKYWAGSEIYRCLKFDPFQRKTRISGGIRTISLPQVRSVPNEDANIGQDPKYIVASSSIRSKGRCKYWAGSELYRCLKFDPFQRKTRISGRIRTISLPQVRSVPKEDANIGQDPNYIVASSLIRSKGRRSYRSRCKPNSCV
jgi:uncharacterized protein (DUF736 family)